MSFNDDAFSDIDALVAIDSTNAFSITNIEFELKVCSSSSSSSSRSSSSSTSSSSESYSSSSESAAAPPPIGPNTLFDFTLAGGPSITTRNRINAGVFSSPGTSVRITVAGIGYPGGIGTDIHEITDIYIGEGFEPAVSNDTSIDFAGPPTQITFSGGSPGVVLMPQTAYVSDIIPYILDHTKDQMISMHFGGTGVGCTYTNELFTLVPFHGTGRQMKFAVNEASVIDVNGYTSILNRLTNIIAIEVF